LAAGEKQAGQDCFTLRLDPENVIIQDRPSVKAAPFQTDSGSSSLVSSTPAPVIATADTVTELDTQAQPQIAQGTWFVQLVALSSLEKAEAFWLQISQSLPVLEGGSPRYQEIGNMIRVLVGPGLSSESASLLCDELKQGGQDCLIRSVE
jgi:cell division septation protein DedD